jgi:acyl carrier protein
VIGQRGCIVPVGNGIILSAEPGNDTLNALTFERLAAIISEVQMIPLEQVCPEATLESLEVDSLGALSIITEIEDELGIKLDLSQRIADISVSDLVAIINEQKQI